MQSASEIARIALYRQFDLDFDKVEDLLELEGNIPQARELYNAVMAYAVQKAQLRAAVDAYAAVTGYDES